MTASFYEEVFLLQPGVFDDFSIDINRRFLCESRGVKLHDRHQPEIYKKRKKRTKGRYLTIR